jgi:hypothetical protein
MAGRKEFAKSVINLGYEYEKLVPDYLPLKPLEDSSIKFPIKPARMPV